MVPLKDLVVFPHMVVPFFVGRRRSVRSVEGAMAQGRLLFLVPQKKSGVEEPTEADFHPVGTVARILQLSKLPDGKLRLLVEGEERAAVVRFTDTTEAFRVQVRPLKAAREATPQLAALGRSVRRAFAQYQEVSRKAPPEVLAAVEAADDPDRLADLVAGGLPLSVEHKLELLSLEDTAARLERLVAFLSAETELAGLEQEITSRVKRRVEKSQKDWFLTEQMKEIQRELGAEGDDPTGAKELEEKVKARGLTAEAKEKCERELKRLSRMQPMSPESAVLRTYLEWVTDLPWRETTADNRDIERARVILDEDHYDLKKAEGAHPRLHRGSAAQGPGQGTHPLLHRPPGHGQDLARPVGGPGARPQLRAHVPRRGARRGGDPRAPQDLRRSPPGQGAPGDAQGRHPQPRLPAGRDRQDELGLAGGSGLGAAGGARPRAERHLPRSLPRGALRPVRRDVHHHGQLRAQHPVPAARPHGGDRDLGLHRAREARDRRAVPRAEAAGRERARVGGHPVPALRDTEDHPVVHPRGRGAQPRARDRQCIEEDRARRGETRADAAPRRARGGYVRRAGRDGSGASTHLPRMHPHREPLRHPPPRSRTHRLQQGRPRPILMRRPTSCRCPMDRLPRHRARRRRVPGRPSRPRPRPLRPSCT